ncbi:hypothetical protein BIW11_13014 [Tropilaelaps mercedesae]|uniref:Uncharacterized protein n=1 Tax=Tropilaelaps mercedesae TaxID=418985 RepID=A0A1V9X3T6_9ACAR|nr:hypothetical protein BIW11_13014 [Tropilaelaps mercedesae]
MATYPLIRTPFTDFSNSFENYESIKQCRPFYLQFAKCQDAYGGPQQPSKCNDEYADLMECVFRPREQMRVYLIQKQREKLYREGKLPKRYMDPPPPDVISQSHVKERW